jgi:iron complex outermembrane receptor protein
MKRFFFSTLSFILLIFVSFSLYADEQEVTLEEVVVTATRDVEEIRKVAANVTVITRKQIEQSNSEMVIDILRDEAGVVVRDFYGTGKSASVDIRGLGETGLLNTLVLVDGRRVNEIDLSGVDWSQVPLDRVERIEIVRGSGSVLYGDNAVGGVINIITKSPEKPFSAGVETAGGSYHLYKGSGAVSGKWGPLSAILSAGYHSTDGYRENGFFRAKDVGGKALYDLNDAVRFNFSGSLHRDDTGLPFGLPKPLYELDRRASIHPDDKAETDDQYGVWGIQAKLWDLGRIEADLSYRHREVSDSFPSSSFRDVRKLNTWGFTPKYIFEKPLFGFPNKMIFGFDFYQSESNTDSQSDFSGPNEAEVKKRTTGLYALDEFSVFKNLILSLGYRQEWATYDLFMENPSLKDKVRENEPAYSASINYLFDKRSSAFFSFKRSFRFPVSDELIQFIFIPPVSTVQVNPDIKPQTGYHYEAGIHHAFNERIEADLTFFRIDLHDEIFFNPITYTNENYPKTRRQGIEAGLKVKPLEWLSLRGNYSYIRAFLVGGPFSGNRIPGVSRHKGAMEADIDLGKGFFFNAKANLFGSRPFISDFANQAPQQEGYYTLDTRVSYGWKGLKAFVGVNNLFNRKYAEFAVLESSTGTQYFYASPTRNFIGGLSYSF